MRALAAVLCLLALSGCLGDLEMPRLSLGPGSEAPRDIAVARGALTIGGPRGYCIDRQASRLGTETEFVVLGPCDAIDRSGAADGPLRRAILTATVLPLPDGTDPPSAGVMEDWFRTESGRGILARSGNAQDVTVLRSHVSGDTLLMNLRDAGAYEGPPVAADYWRAVFSLNGQMITLAVLTPADLDLASASARVILEQFVDRVRLANPAPR